MSGCLTFLEHYIRCEKEFPDLTDDANLVGYQKDYNDLSRLSERTESGHKKENYKNIVKDLNKDFPNCNVKLAGEYLKIFMSNSDEHRTVTDEKTRGILCDPPTKLSPPENSYQRTSDLHGNRRNTQRLNQSRFLRRKGGTAHQSKNKIPASHFYGGAQKITRLTRYF
ncbi:hypothetical protein TNCV_4675981 [Trichonephila clavipes]|nr:hypothetical protein TNCV_4675981 [Trichonephila clavipes]